MRGFKRGGEKIMRNLPGFISANIHISDDKKTVANYVQWETLADFENMLKDKKAQVHMKKAASIAINYTPVTYSEIWDTIKIALRAA